MRIPNKSELTNKDESYLYKQDTDAYGSFSSLERINKIIQLVKKYSKGKKILDLGCAQGNIAILLAEEGFNTTALDLNQNFLKYAEKKREFGNISYVCANALNTPFKKNTFNVVILGELIEHVAYPEKLIQETKRCLKKNGILIITVPNKHVFSGLISRHKLLLFNKIKNKGKKEAIKKQFGPSGSDHLFIFNMFCLKKLIVEQNLKIIKKGHINSCFINQFSYQIFKFLPKFFLHFLNNLLVKIPLIKSKLSLGLYIAAKNE